MISLIQQLHVSHSNDGHQPMLPKAGRAEKAKA
jgi:hypothetical protein